MRGSGTGSTLVLCDPSVVAELPEYADPQALYHQRLARVQDLEWQVREIRWAASAPKGNKYQEISGTRLFWNSEPEALGNGTGVKQSRWVGQKVRFSVPVDGELILSVNLNRLEGWVGDVVVEVQTDAAGVPSGQSLGSATVAQVSIPLTENNLGPGEWVSVAASLSEPIEPATPYWIVLKGTDGDGGFSAIWKAGTGNWSLATGSSTSDGGATWTHSSDVGYALRINHDGVPPYLVIGAVCFDSTWVILYGGLNRGAGINLNDEESDADNIRYHSHPLLPWRLEDAHLWSANKAEPMSGAATLMVAELPTDW